MKRKKKWKADEELYQLHQDIGEILSSELDRMKIDRGVRNVKRMLKPAQKQALIF